MIALEQDRPILRWSGSFAVVSAAHALVIGGALWWRSHDIPEPLPEPTEAIMVELAPLPAAPPAPPTELPPGPPQQEQRKTPAKAEPNRPAEPEEPPPKEIAREAETALPQPAREPQNQESASTDVAQTRAPPSVQAPAARQYAARQSLSGGGAQSLSYWQAQILGHLERFKRYPRAAQRRRYEGVVQVRYAVDRQGNVLSAHLISSSGREPLDAEAVAALQRASPLPPPPPDIPGDPIEVTTPVKFFLR